MQIFKLIILLIFVSSAYSQKKTPKLTCETRNTSDNNDSLYSSTTKTCLFKNYKFVTVGAPDIAGKYAYESFIYKIDNGKDIPIKNSDIFLNAKEIEKLLNKKLKKKIAAAMAIEEDSECMKFAQFKEYKVDEIAITFNESNEMEFDVNINLPDACYSLSFIEVSLKLNIIEKYLK